MNAPHVSDYESVLDRVRAWPAADRFALIQEVLQTIAPAPNGGTVAPATLPAAQDTTREEDDWWAPKPDDDKRTAALKRLRGIAARPDRPPPTDEEVDRWREEWRMEKYG